MIDRKRGLIALVLAAGLGGGCSGSAAGDSSTVVALSVFAAASLRDALATVRATYEASTPGVTLTIVTDSSATLRTQIEQGAPADVFLSADQENPSALIDEGLADGPAVDFAGNRLTIIVPSDNPAGIETPADLANPGVTVIAAGDEVPITTYTEQAIDNLADDPGVPAGFAEGYAANVASREQNVQAVVAKIELGEGDAAIVYMTDAATAVGVATLALPTESEVPATYSGVVVSAAPHDQEAHAFLDWLVGAEGQATLAMFGFVAPS